MALAPDANLLQIRDVWANNVDAEFDYIRDLIDHYPYVAMDTEFPGSVCTLPPKGHYNDPNYHLIKMNVNLTKLIQLGLTLCDEQGNLPAIENDRPCIWQFNFCDFDHSKDQSAEDSINLLLRSGIDFAKNSADGVRAARFGELLMSSGIVANPDMKWIMFHGSADVGYVIKLLTQRDLPETREEFYGQVRVFFPSFYDMKHVLETAGLLYGGLAAVGAQLGVPRIGVAHQAGSDSLMTSCVFRRVKENYFNNNNNNRDIGDYAGVLFRLG